MPVSITVQPFLYRVRGYLKLNGSVCACMMQGIDDHQDDAAEIAKEEGEHDPSPLMERWGGNLGARKSTGPVRPGLFGPGLFGPGPV